MNASDYKRERDQARARVAQLEAQQAEYKALLKFSQDTCDISIANTDHERARRIKAEDEVKTLKARDARNRPCQLRRASAGDPAGAGQA